MSTKINARSPFYIEAEEPTASLGTFTCDIASLRNFAVDRYGNITEPSVRYGEITDRSETSFAELNVGDSDTLRSVDYTIKIPDNYSNTTDLEIVCTQTFTQLAPTAACDSSTNTNMSTFTGTIPDITGLTLSGSSVTLNTYFTQQGGATFKDYIVRQIGDAGITYELTGTGVNQTITFYASNDCLDASFTITARNNGDSCTTSSNQFTVTASCTKTLTCSTSDATNDAINLQGGSIAADGTITRPQAGFGSFKEIKYNGSVITSHSENDTGSARDVILTFVYYIPNGYINTGEIECNKTFSQPPTSSPLPTLDCSSDLIRYENFRIATTGDIVQGDARVLVGGVEASFTVDTLGVTAGTAFPINYTQEPITRTIGVKITVPSGFSNTGSIIACTKDEEQPPLYGPCAGVEAQGTYYITQGFDFFDSLCGSTHSMLTQVFGTRNRDQIVCYNGSPYNGGNKWYGHSTSIHGTAGDGAGTFGIMQIDEFGYIAEYTIYNCDDNSDNITW